MPNYFKPLRRKIGVLALAMACVATIWWVRSLSGIDGIVIYGRIPAPFSISSVYGRLEWETTRDTTEIEALSFPVWVTHARGRIPYSIVLNEDDPDIKWSWRFCGIGGGRIPELNSLNRPISFCVTPYWSIVVPLTLLSAWLLFSKLRVPKPERTTDANRGEYQKSLLQNVSEWIQSKCAFQKQIKRVNRGRILPVHG